MIFARVSRWLVGALVLAAVLRVTGIGFDPFHPDEHLVIHHALAFGTGDLNPHMFYYPTFFLYQIFALFGLYYALGHAAGAFANADAFLSAFLANPAPVYVLARVLSAFYGTATVWVVYRLGRLCVNERTGLIAAWILALSFLHVRDSHFATVDIALAFYMGWSFIYVLKALDERDPAPLAAASFIAGLAMAVKYNAVVLGLPIALAFFLCGKKPARTLSFMAASPVLAFLGFFIGTPYFILDLEHALPFIVHLRQINTHYQLSPFFHAAVLGEGMGWTWFFCALAGLAGAVVVPKKRLVFAVLLAAYYGMITRIGQPFERYALPLIPFLTVFAAVVLDFIWGRLRSRPVKIIAIILAGTALIAQGSKTLYSDWLFFQTDSRELASRWIAQNVPARAAVAVDLSMYAPKLWPTEDQLDEKIAKLDAADPRTKMKTKRLDLLRSAHKETPAYRLYYLTDSIEPLGSGPTLNDPQVLRRPEALEEVRAAYLVTSDVAMAHRPGFYEELKKNWRVAARFDSRRSGPDPHASGGTYLPIDASLWEYERPGPTVYVMQKQ